MFALVDCNNFFVSCERAFQPQLEGRPVVVLSNNDGCIVSRSNEAKALGIRMGTPFFKVKGLVESGMLEVRSSNYALYGDMSERVMRILRKSVPKITVYSIDEAFIDLGEMSRATYMELCTDLKDKIRRCTGIPVSIGIAPTKTLGKAASHFAKRYPGYHGVCAIDTEEKRIKALSLTGVKDIWGIGWRGAPKLISLGIRTAADLVSRPEAWVRRHLGTPGLHTWMELKGIPAIHEEPLERTRSICTSRSFAEMTDSLEDLSIKVADFAAACARKLREENSLAAKVLVFIQTNHFRSDLPQYCPSGEERLSIPANSTQEIVGAAIRILGKIYRPGFSYKRAGVIVEDTSDASLLQTSIFDTEDRLKARDKENTVSELMDRINEYGPRKIRLGAQGEGHYGDGVRHEYRSGAYTTDWNSIIEVR